MRGGYRQCFLTLDHLPGIGRDGSRPGSNWRPFGRPLNMRGDYVLANGEGLGRLIRRTLHFATIPPVEPTHP